MRHGDQHREQVRQCQEDAHIAKLAGANAQMAVPSNTVSVGLHAGCLGCLIRTTSWQLLGPVTTARRAKGAAAGFLNQKCPGQAHNTTACSD